MRIDWFRLLAVVVITLSIAPGTLEAADTLRVGDLRIDQPWARASIGASRPAAAYFSIVNTGNARDRLLRLESPIAGRIEIHRSMIKGGIMRMEAAGALEIPARQTVTLKPGHLHVMLMKLKAPLRRGTTFSLVLKFEKAGAVELQVPIFGPGASGPR